MSIYLSVPHVLFLLTLRLFLSFFLLFFCIICLSTCLSFFYSLFFIHLCCQKHFSVHFQFGSFHPFLSFLISAFPYLSSHYFHFLSLHPNDPPAYPYISSSLHFTYFVTSSSSSSEQQPEDHPALDTSKNNRLSYYSSKYARTESGFEI
jgi:hypothetical protein